MTTSFSIPFRTSEPIQTNHMALSFPGIAWMDRQKKIMEYIKTALQHTNSIELWHVWLMDYYEFEDRPFLHQSVLPFSQLSPAHLQALEDSEIWNTPDKQYPNRPSFYCLTITRG